MHRGVVDDVQGSCYYQTVPRVKSGLPVRQSCWMRNLRWRQAPGKSWLSFEEIRTRLEVGPGTPSLKRPAKTFAPGHIFKPGSHARLCGKSRRNGAPPNLVGNSAEVRR